MYVQLAGTHTVTDSNEWAGHLFPKVVDHREEISGVIEPGGCMGGKGVSVRSHQLIDWTRIQLGILTVITKFVLVHDSTHSLM